MRVLAFLLALLTPTVALAAQVRTDRPRMLLSNGSGPGTSLATFKQRCSTDPGYSSRCQYAIDQGSGSLPAAAAAAGYLVNDDVGKCAEAYATLQTVADDAPGQPGGHAFISNNGRTMLQLAIVRDWCDGALSSSEAQWIEDRMVAYADWYLAYTGLDVYHDDMNNVWSAVALAGLSLKGTAQDAKADGYLAAAESQWKDVIFPALAYAGDWWHEGFVYVQPAVASAAWFATAWTVATDEDLYAYAATNAGDLFHGYLAMHAYAMRPDYRYVYFGDTSDNKQSIELFSRYLVDMLTQGTGSALGQGLSLEILQNSQAHYDYSGADSWMLALFYDASLDGTAVERESLPRARWHGQGSNDIAILRSGWGPDDTFLWVSCGDYFGAHQHYEAGSFQLFAHGLLTGSTGYYDAFDSDHWQNYYSQHSVHANTLAVYQPGEFFPTLQSLSDPGANVNDGGQRVLRRDENGTAYPNPDLAAYLSHKDGPPYNETGDLVTFESAECHDYVACDVTAAYNSTSVATNGNTAKVSEVSRQFVFLRPELLVIFDRVEATDAAYEKRFLLHTLGDPQVDGNVFMTDNGGGRLIGQTLLPAQADIEVIANFAVEGTPHPPSNTGNESGGTRLEISPSQEGARDYFFHVLHATTPATTEPPTASLVEDDATATVTIELDGTTYAVTFAKAGDLGGHLTVTTGGSIDCDQDLGEHASSSGAGGGGAGGAGTGGSSSGGGGVTPGSTSAADDSGCGCRQGGAKPGGGRPWLGLLGPFAVALLALRRRRPASHRAAWRPTG